MLGEGDVHRDGGAGARVGTVTRHDYMDRRAVVRDIMADLDYMPWWERVEAAVLRWLMRPGAYLID